LNVVRGQQVHHYLPGSNWDGSFVTAGNLIWVGVVLLLADAVISGLGPRLGTPLGRRTLRALPLPLPADAGPVSEPAVQGAQEHAQPEVEAEVETEVEAEVEASDKDEVPVEGEGLRTDAAADVAPDPGPQSETEATSEE
ncbi:MAG TPA: hypothetical protein VEG62_02870, partial [Acidimicrobiales bacterium]|nr:hypothetical protein [Acidimicrobiales bacterium]